MTFPWLVLPPYCLGLTHQPGPKVSSKALEELVVVSKERPQLSYITWTDEVTMLHHKVGKKIAKDDGENPSSQEAFDSLLWRQFNQLSTTKGDATDISEYVISDDEEDRQEYPYHSLKDGVNSKLSLNDNQEESYMGPCELCKLVFILPLL
jgi:hypothetical protein